MNSFSGIVHKLHHPTVSMSFLNDVGDIISVPSQHYTIESSASVVAEPSNVPSATGRYITYVRTYVHTYTVCMYGCMHLFLEFDQMFVSKVTSCTELKIHCICTYVAVNHQRFLGQFQDFAKVRTNL